MKFTKTHLNGSAYTSYVSIENNIKITANNTTIIDCKSYATPPSKLLWSLYINDSYIASFKKLKDAKQVATDIVKEVTT